MSDLLNSASLVMIPSGYKEDTVYSQIPTDGSGDLPFTRASNGTRINSAGLVEVCPWNLADNSENFSAVYIPIYATLSNNTTSAPNGTTTADSLLETTDTEVHAITTDYTQPSGAEYTYSVYVKTISGRNVRVSGSSGFSGPIALVDLSNGSLLSGSTGATVASVGGGWYRISLTATTTTTQVRILIYSMNGTATTFAGSISNGVYLWGAQLNIGSTAKPYFPTTDRLNVPRLTYQNGGGGCPSLLLEKQSTNLALQSQSFTSPWAVDSNLGTTPVITQNYGISPDGTQNATRLQLARTNSNLSYSQLFQYPITMTIGQQYTYSVWIKSLSGTPTVTIVSEFGRPTATATSEWVRYSGTGTATSAVGQLEIGIFGSTYSTGNSLSADILIWGYQFEQSSYPTSYIPTTSSSATRVADVAVKSSISSLFGASATSLFMDFEITQVSNGGNWTVTGWDGTNLFSLCQFDNASNYPRIVFDGGVDITLGTALSIGRHKIAVSFTTNDFRAYIDGVLVHTDTICTYNRYDRIALNGTAWTGNTNNTNSFKLNEYAQFPNVLTNAELASLTTI